MVHMEEAKHRMAIQAVGSCQDHDCFRPYTQTISFPEGPYIQLSGNEAPKYHTIEGIMDGCISDPSGIVQPKTRMEHNRDLKYCFVPRS